MQDGKYIIDQYSMYSLREIRNTKWKLFNIIV